MYGQWDITGTLSPDTTATGVDDSWSNGNPVSVISSGSCTTSGYVSSLALIAGQSASPIGTIDDIKGGSLTGSKINLYNYGGQIWGDISDTGSGCTQTDLDGIKIKFDCNAIISVKCKRRFDSSSNTIRVKLSGSTKFESGPDKPIKLVSDGTTEITDPWYHGLWWVQDTTGKMSPSTDSTTVSYSFYSIAQPGDSIPAELWCYDNCPIGYDASSVSSLSTYASIMSVTEVSVNDQGECSPVAKNGASITFTGYTTNPNVTLGWTENTGSSNTTYYTLTSVTITNPGVLDPTKSPSWTLSFSTTCTSSPSLNSINANYGDYKDYRSVYKYSYDSAIGILTDKKNSKPVLITDPTSHNDASFGPFFEGTAANKAALLCPWNSNLVCSWQVWQKLSQTYNWRTGPNSIRVALLDASNKPLPFDAPTSLLYQVPQGTKSNSGAKYDGINLFMTYYNFGELQGIPQLCVDSMNEPANCISDSRFSDATTNINDIIMASGNPLKDFGGNSYYVGSQHSLPLTLIRPSTNPAFPSFASIPSHFP